MIIDAHAHVMKGFHGRTGAGTTRSLPFGRAQVGNEEMQFLPPLHPGPTAFVPETLLGFMDWVGVDKTVLLQGPFYGEENKYLHEVVRRWPDRFIAAGLVDPRGEAAEQTFARVTGEFKFPIIKFELTETTGLTGLYPDFRLDEQRMAWVWPELERRGLVVTLDLGRPQTRAYQTDAVRAIIDRHPSLRMVIAHLCQPPVADADNEQLNALWQQQVELARCANVWLDLAALPAYGSQPYPYPTALQYVRRAVDLVGADKLLWGTDVPGLLGVATYRQLLDMYRLEADFLSDADLDNILGENAAAVYG